MKPLLLLLLLPTNSFCFTSPQVQEANRSEINRALNEIARELNRISLKSGGKISQNLNISSSTDVSGYANFQDSVTVKNAVISDTTFSAWVHFDGTGSISIKEEVNVKSINDNGTGNYTINYSTPMVSANYYVNCNSFSVNCWITALSTGSVSINTTSSSESAADPTNVFVGVVGKP